MAKKKLTFEQALNRLEDILSLIENEDVDLDQSVTLYKEGLELSIFCKEKLGKIEEEITFLKDRGNQNEF